MKRTFQGLRNSSGQMTMELILLISVGIAAFAAVKKGVGNISPLKKAFGTNVPNSPWARINAMVQYGVWIDNQDPTPMNTAKTKHPNAAYRYLSSETQ